MSGADYARIQTSLRGRFRPLQGPNDPPRADHGAFFSGPTREEFMTASPLPEAVNRFLCRLDAKVDFILAGMASSTLDADFPHTMEILAIGASGMDFTCAEPLAPGDWIEVMITLRQENAFTAAGVGSITNRREERDGTPVFTFRFSRIAEEEREKIIRFVFMEERRRLRETRLEQEQPGL